jgi:hypothetical protein
MRSAEQAARAARQAKHWREVARIRREQAVALYREAGTPKPPPDEVLALLRAWSDAALRALVGFGPQAEMVSAGCCRLCNQDDERKFRITAELKEHRLPHAGCPKGICDCDWSPLPRSAPGAKRARKRPAPAVHPGQPEPAIAPDPAVPDPVERATGPDPSGL